MSTSDTSSAAAERPQLRTPCIENASLELPAPEDAPPMHGMDSPLDLSDTSLEDDAREPLCDTLAPLDDAIAPLINGVDLRTTDLVTLFAAP